MNSLEVYPLVETLVPGVRRVMADINEEIVKDDPEHPEMTWFDIQMALARQGSISGEAMKVYMDFIESTKEYNRKRLCSMLRSLAIKRAQQEDDDVTAVVPDCDTFIQKVLFHVMMTMSWADITSMAGPKSPPAALTPVVKKAVTHSLASLTRPRVVNPKSDASDTSGSESDEAKDEHQESDKDDVEADPDVQESKKEVDFDEEGSPGAHESKSDSESDSEPKATLVVPDDL